MIIKRRSIAKEIAIIKSDSNGSKESDLQGSRNEKRLLN